jgi:hypothetical protein
MASTIINCSELNINDLKFYAPKATQGGGKNVGVMNKKTNSALRMKLPIMFTFGASDYDGNEKFSFALQFPDIHDEACDPKYKVCFERLVEFEASLKRKVLEFSKDWLGKQLKNEEMVDMIWSPMLKYPKNKESKEPELNRPPTLNVKLPCFEGKWSSEVYDEDRNMLFPNPEDPSLTPVNFITRGNNMATIIQFGGLWIVGGKIGTTWKLVQTVVQQQVTTIQGKCHIDMDEGDKTVLKKKVDISKHQDPEEMESASSSSAISTEVVDSDDEKEPQEQDEVDEEPVAVIAAPSPASVTMVAHEAENKKAKGRGKK